MQDVKLVNINELTDLKNKPALQPYHDPNPDGPTVYTSPKGKTFDPLQHEVDKVTGDPSIRADGEFKMLRGWQGAKKIDQALQNKQSDIETDIIEKGKNDVTADNKSDSIRMGEQFEPHDLGHQPPDSTRDPEQRPGSDSANAEEFDIPADNTYFDDPADTADAEALKQKQIDEYIESQAHIWMQACEGIMVMAIGPEWILTEEEHRILQRPAARCMKKYGIYELWPEVDLMVCMIMVSKNRLNPKTHPRTATLWDIIKYKSVRGWHRFWWWASRKEGDFPADKNAEELTESQEAEAKQNSQTAEGEQV